ncbi:MAG: hypothetical protein R2856_01305 [Caldilineaceae bacterium]
MSSVPSSRYAAQSEELFDLYRELDRKLQQERYAEDIVEQGVLDQRAQNRAQHRAQNRADEQRYAMSQWRLMWRKFVRNRAALTGGIVIVTFYIVALFANFLSPYTLTTRFRDRVYLPPQGIHFFDEGRLSPFVYGVKTSLNIETFERESEVDTSVKYPVRFFVKGEPYKLFGLIEADIHLFGVEGDGAINLLGTDRQGRDMLTRAVGQPGFIDHRPGRRGPQPLFRDGAGRGLGLLRRLDRRADPARDRTGAFVPVDPAVDGAVGGDSGGVAAHARLFRG